MTEKNHRVVIVGGGFAGVKAALELSNVSGFSVSLISTHTNFEYHSALYRSATGRSPLEVVVPLSSIFKRSHNVEVILDTIAGINPLRKILRSETGNEYAYDTVILAMGNEVNYFGITGMPENSYAISTITQTIALRAKLIELFRKSESTPKVVIVGAGPTGVELAGELRYFARMVSRKYHTHIAHPHIMLIEAGDRILPSLDPIISAKAYKKLIKLNVELRLSTIVNACEPGKLCIADGDIDADIIIWTAGSKAVGFYQQHPKIFALERGKVRVNEYLQSLGHEDIYVLGDNANTKYSGMAQTAIYDAKFVVRNMLRQRKGQRPVEYRNRFPLYVVPVGQKWAVMQSANHKISGYKGWVMRRRADRWIFRNFLPYKQAIKQWRKTNKLARI